MEQGFFVIDPRGHVGLTGATMYGMTTVQYGSAGPHSVWKTDSLRYATQATINVAGLNGVGGSIKEETGE